MKTTRAKALSLMIFVWLLLMPCFVFAQYHTVKRSTKAKTEQKTEQKEKSSNTKKDKTKNSKKEQRTTPSKVTTPPKDTAPKNEKNEVRLLNSTNGNSNTNLNPVINNLINNMVYVEGGSFTMGATSEQGTDAFSDEKPAHSVSVSSFSIGKYEVTQKEWQAVMGSNPSKFKGDNRPVEQVSWDDCQEFIRKLNQLTGQNFRLPTEAEWEYAARGGNESRGYKYAGSNALGNVAWYSDNSGSTTHAVGTKQANELGLYDMSGNVSEWCQDWYGNYSSASQNNPAGPSTGSRRVNRGGSWDNSARYCRVSLRGNYTPADRGSNLGLRLAL